MVHHPRRFVWDGRVLGSDDKSKTLRFAHCSKEHLVSRRLSLKDSHPFKLDPDSAHDLIARLCLIYLLSIHGVFPFTENTLLSPPFFVRRMLALTEGTGLYIHEAKRGCVTFPLTFLHYGAQRWHVHYGVTQHGERYDKRLASTLVLRT